MECLVCLKNCLPKGIVQQLEETELETAEECQTVKKQLPTIFLLRKFLEIPQEVCCKLLEDHGDPCLWIDCCDSHSILVERARRLFDKITLLLKQYKKLQEEFKAVIISSFESHENIDYSSKAKTTEIVRSYVSQGHRLSSDFVRDDLNNFEDEIKTEIEENLEETFLDRLEDPLINYNSESELEKRDNDDVSLNSGKRDPSWKLKRKTNLKARNNASIKRKKTTKCNPKTAVENIRRSRSGRVIKRKYNYNSDNEFDDFTKQQEISDSEYSPRTSPIKKEFADEDKVYEGNASCLNRNNSIESDENLVKNEGKFQCIDCPKNYLCRYNLVRHRKREHYLSASITKEKENGEKTNDAESTPLQEYICEKCGRKFCRKFDLNRHVKRVHECPSELKIFSCEVCSRTLTSKSRLKNHMVTHDQNRFKCEECGKIFSRKNSLGHHIKRIHRNEREFSCEICHSSFTKRKYLRYHEIKVHNINLENKNVQLQCDECGKVLGEPAVLREHIKRVHLKIFKFRCPVCNVGRSNASAMKKHLKQAHTNERPEVCEVCQKSFIDKTKLKIHMRRHTGETPYKCKFCPKGFIDNKAKTRHEKGIHSEGKAFQCELCGKSYPSNDYLTAHRWYSHNNKQSTLPPRKIISKAEIDKIVNEEQFIEKSQKFKTIPT